jgi:hypothetical protein
MLKRMIAPVLALLVSTLPSVAGSQAVTSKHKASAPTADVLNESFNNATNYDDGLGAGAWAEAEVDGGDIDSNETVLCPVGTGFGSQCLESTAGAANRKAHAENDLGSGRDDQLYVVVYFAMTGMGAWTDASSQVIVEGRTLAGEGASIATAAFGAALIYDADGITSGYNDCAGPTACWRLNMRIGGVGGPVPGGLPQVVPDTIYKLKFRVDKGSATGEAVLNSTTIVSSQDSTYTLQYVRLGQEQYSLAAETILFDNLKISTTGYVE